MEIRHNGCIVVFYLGQTKKQNVNWQKYFDDFAVIKFSFFPADHAAKEPVEDTDPSTLSLTMVCVSGLVQLKSLQLFMVM